MHENPISVRFAAIHEGASVHATNRVVVARATIGRTSAETSNLNPGVLRKTLVDVGIAVGTANWIEGLRAAVTAFVRTHPCARYRRARRAGNTFVAVSLSIVAADRIVLHCAGHIALCYDECRVCRRENTLQIEVASYRGSQWRRHQGYGQQSISNCIFHHFHLER